MVLCFGTGRIWSSSSWALSCASNYCNTFFSIFWSTIFFLRRKKRPGVWESFASYLNVSSMFGSLTNELTRGLMSMWVQNCCQRRLMLMWGWNFSQGDSCRWNCFHENSWHTSYTPSTLEDGIGWTCQSVCGIVVMKFLMDILYS
jgi:hypothetical protein